MAGLFVPTPSDLSTGTLDDIFTAPDGYTVKITVIFCNRDSAGTSIRLSVAPAGAADAVEQYLLFDYALAANDYHSMTELSIQGGDVVRALAAATNKVSANVFINDVRSLLP